MKTKPAERQSEDSTARGSEQPNDAAKRNLTEKAKINIIGKVCCA